MKTKKLKKQYLTPPNTSQFGQHSIAINGNVLRVTGDAREATQVEMLWDAMEQYIFVMPVSVNTPAELQDWIRNTLASPNDDKALKLFASQQSELQKINTQIGKEQLLTGEISNESVSKLGAYSMFQLALQVLFGIADIEIGDSLQYMLDAQRNNTDLVVQFNHLADNRIVLATSASANTDKLH